MANKALIINIVWLLAVVGAFVVGSRRAGEGVETSQEALASKTAYRFSRRRHDFADKVLLGRTIKGSGKGEIDQALDRLASHPSTAKHISYKLCQYFVADDPSEALVARVASRFSRTDGDIREVMRAILSSQEFWDSNSYRAKFKTPLRYTLSSLRATNCSISDTRLILGFLRMQGMPLYQCATPDGYKNTQKAWLNSNSLIQRINFATALGIGRLRGADPREDRYQKVFHIAGIVPGSRSERVIASSPKRLRLSLVLGSPEFMKH